MLDVRQPPADLCLTHIVDDNRAVSLDRSFDDQDVAFTGAFVAAIDDL